MLLIKPSVRGGVVTSLAMVTPRQTNKSNAYICGPVYYTVVPPPPAREPELQ